MGGGSSKADDPNAANNADIDLHLIDQHLEEMFKFKVLLLGAGESGKSTVVKQLKLIHKKKINPKELRIIAISLHQNVVDCMKSLLQATRAFGYTLDAAAAKLDEDLQNHDETQLLTPELGQRITQVFESAEIQAAYERRAEYWILDSFTYYLRHLDRFTAPDFEPTEEDGLMARIRTTGIINTELDHPLEDRQRPELEPEFLKFCVVDVGGQRNERKKWMHAFDDVRAILFIVNLAGFNQCLFEDSAKNRMLEELELFQQISNNQLFENTPIFLFLNKVDLFETMIMGERVDMRRTFSDYDGGRALQPALAYIMELFRSKLPQDKSVRIHPVSARWKKDIRLAFEDVKRVLYDDNRDELIRQAEAIKAHKQRAARAARKEEGGCGC